MRALPVSLLHALAASACLVLAACGFQPLYGGAGSGALDNVTIVVEGDERLSYLTETALIERTGQSSGPVSRLTVAVRTGQNRLGVSADGQATRVALNARALYIYDDGSGAPLEGIVGERIVFETPREPYALLAAQANAERRAAEALADAVVRDVLASLHARQADRVRPAVTPAAAPPAPQPQDR